MSKENILIVDDVVANLIALSEMIKKAGYSPRPVTSAKQAMQAVDALLPDLILLDISMPEIDGFEYCGILKKNARTRNIPVIFISALTSPTDKAKGFQMGGVDFISKPFEIEEVTMRVNTHLTIHKLSNELSNNNERLSKLVSDSMYKITEEEKNVVSALAHITDIIHPGRKIEAYRANIRLISLSLQFSPAYEKYINNEFADKMEISAPLCDIGNIAVGHEIIKKNDKLTAGEYECVKLHVEEGLKIITDVLKTNAKNEFLRLASEITEFHHERFDGSGYPKGISGEMIPLSARVAGLVDTYMALVSERPYRKAFTHEEAIDIINENQALFDPIILDIFLKVQRQLETA